MVRSTRPTEVPMKPHLACLALTLALTGICSGQNGVYPIKDAPFSAETHSLSTGSTASSTETRYIARSSNGSVYQATVIPVGEFKGSIDHVHFQDITSHCSIDVTPFQSNMTKNSRSQWIGVSTAMHISLTAAVPQPRIFTVEGIRENLTHLQQGWANGLVTDKPQGEIHHASLGEKNIDGMTLFGLHSETTPGSPKYYAEDRWESDLGFTYSRSTTNPADGSSWSYTFTNFKRAEPDPALFRIQDKYFPPTNIFSNARTVFIAPIIGHDDVQRQIESILTASGRLTIAPDSKSADLVVASNPVPAKVTSTSQVIPIDFRKPNGTRILSVMLHFERIPEPWADSAVIHTCFANLWNQIETLPQSSGLFDEQFPGSNQY
jgi:hypothetical protein